MVEVTRLVPVDATDAMVAAALDCNWEYEDEVGLVHNIWHAMCAAAALEPKTASEFWNRRAQQLTDEIERLEKALETAREDAIEEAAKVADAARAEWNSDAGLWGKEGMALTAMVSRHHAKAASLVAAAIRTLSQKKEG